MINIMLSNQNVNGIDLLHKPHAVVMRTERDINFGGQRWRALSRLFAWQLILSIYDQKVKRHPQR
jgi:hypothetical protein